MEAVEKITPECLYKWSACDIAPVITNSSRNMENILEKLSKKWKDLTKHKKI